MKQVSRVTVWIAALVLLFGFRLWFGLSGLLFTDDETQIYLLGLRFHASGAWPYFGPDVVWTQTQMPGALQALLVGLPFSILPIPEAPYVLLNIISMASLALFAWYLGVRLPGVPRWLLWGWLFTLPWTLELSTHIINPSYVLAASVVFFVGFLEAWPALSVGRVPVPLCFAAMGAALGWMAQVHMSWPLLLPFIGFAFVSRIRLGWRGLAVAGAAFVAGFGLTGSLMVPTWMKYGIFIESGGTGENVTFHWREPVSTIAKVVARLLSFASYEINRFIAPGSAAQIVFLQDHWWLVPPVAVLGLTGLAQPLWMALTAFRRKSHHVHWPMVRRLLMATVLLVSSSFFFSVAWAQARSFYVVAPVALLYAAYCWTFIDSRRARTVAAVVLAVNVAVQASLAFFRFSGPSLYLNRPLVAQAIHLRTPNRFALRRPWGRDVTPDVLTSSFAGADAARDLVLDRAERSHYFRDIVVWDLSIRNQSSSVAYRDLYCETNYFDLNGRVVDAHREVIRLVLQPGESRSARLIDGARWTGGIATASVKIFEAQPLRPMAATGERSQIRTAAIWGPERTRYLSVRTISGNNPG